MKNSDTIKQQLDVTDIFCDAVSGGEVGDEITRFLRENGIRVVKDIEMQVQVGQYGGVSVVLNTMPD
ncbi:MAG: hypothetical protein JJ916_04210 [Phycisphaerales bacterium]|nr:hypothetical protein [Phycisphaerales bacterium]